MPISPILVVVILAIIVIVFLGLFLFRGQSSEERMLSNELKRLYADKNATERTSLVWRTQEEDDGSLRAYVMWMEGYAEIDPVRGIPVKSFDEFGALEKEDGVRWRLPYEDGSPQMILSTSQNAFEEKLRELTLNGWEMQLVLPFSERDRIVFLSR
jgi:hypothetical protein